MQSNKPSKDAWFFICVKNTSVIGFYHNLLGDELGLVCFL